MDFVKVLGLVGTFLDEREYRYALVGAFALSALGYSRATQDLDFAVESRAADELVSYLEKLGYETLYRSEGYSNHVHPMTQLGRIDFVYVYEPTSKSLFEAAKPERLAGRTIAIPKPEHLAAMKVLAIKNDPQRKFKELADLQFLLSIDGIDTEEIRGHFQRYGLEELFDELIRYV